VTRGFTSDAINGFAVRLGEGLKSINRFNRHCYIFVSVKNQDLDFQRHRSWSFIVFSDLMGEAIVRFVDIGGP